MPDMHLPRVRDALSSARLGPILFLALAAAAFLTLTPGTGRAAPVDFFFVKNSAALLDSSIAEITGSFFFDADAKPRPTESQVEITIANGNPFLGTYTQKAAVATDPAVVFGTDAAGDTLTITFAINLTDMPVSIEFPNGVVWESVFAELVESDAVSGGVRPVPPAEGFAPEPGSLAMFATALCSLGGVVAWRARSRKCVT